MATTTNYSWTTPDDTDLVKDGAASIRTLGSSADTTVKNLNPGTTAGDIDYYTSSTAKARIAIGTDGQILAVNSGATAPEWIAAPSAGLTLITTQTIGSGVSSITVTSAFSATYDNYKIIVSGGVASGNGTLRLQLGATTTDYYWWGISGDSSATTVSGDRGSNVASFIVGACSTNSLSAEIDLSAPFLSKRTTCFSQGIRTVTPGVVKRQFGFQNSDTSFTSFILDGTGGETFTGGTIKVYGYKN